MQWLRERFREHELPQEIDFPPAEAYAKVDFAQFANVRLKYGYQLEIVWLYEEKSWALQLTEPDLGPSPGNSRQKRSPVAGRIFETNISYQVTDKGVLCGFQTMVSEPDGTKVPCEVYRLGVIKHLKRNPLVGLQQIWTLIEEPHNILTTADIKSFIKKIRLKDRTLPVIVISEYIPPSVCTQTSSTNANHTLPDLQKILTGGLISNSLASGLAIPFQKTEEVVWPNNPALPYWLAQISHDRMGYAHFFVVAAAKLDEFNRSTGYNLPDGGVIVIPSPQIDEPELRYHYEEASRDTFQLVIDGIIQNYSKDKRFDFTSCRFVPQALEIHSENMLKNINTEIKKHYRCEK